MVRRLHHFIAALLLTLCGSVAANAQAIGPFTWQFQPYCNRVTLSATQQGDVFLLAGSDDLCGAATRAAVTGTAFLNPDGSIGMGLSIVSGPQVTPEHVYVTIDLATLSGTWRDGGTFTGPFTLGGSAPGAPRPAGQLIGASAFGSGAAGFFGFSAGGSRAAPLATPSGQPLAVFGGGGHIGVDFVFPSAFLLARSTEAFTLTARGAMLDLYTTANLTRDPLPRLSITHDGLVGIGTQTPSDALHVIGDVRVGTGGPNGCVKNNSGGAIVGVCSSDLRFKRDITPFAPSLDRVAALRPVHYYWRSTEFPRKRFGEEQAYGLVAQDVAEVLPELVSTDEDGHQAVDYAKLPLLAIQAIKELKEKNDALERRLAAIEGALAKR